MTDPTNDDGPLVVALRERSYPIHIVDGPVARAGTHAAFWADFLATAGIRGTIALVMNETLAPLYGDALVASLRAAGRTVVPIVVPDGEQFKNAAMLETLHDAMLAARLDRSAAVVALGGGVVGDVAGFAAATYQRGIDFVQVPTTLLAQVDSSVGGKTGINHPRGKNMIGAFHQPRGVVVDLATLDTLPDREFAAGLAEVVKYGAALDAVFFGWLEGAMPRLVGRDRDALAFAIRRSCALKAAVVGDDEREAGARALLNFGHTFGHAIEGARGYGDWLHGEAVAAGMVLAARLSVEEGLIEPDAVERLVRLLRAADLPVDPPSLSLDTWLDWMASDKKADRGRLRFVVLDDIGRSRLATVDDVRLATVLAPPAAAARSLRPQDASTAMAAVGP